MKQVGILLPIFSLPGKYGIGTLGKNAYRFIDFLNKAEVDLWQILPTNPTSFGDSPYQSFSVFAQNPYFVDLDLLVEDKLLTKKDLDESNLINESHYIDYGNIFNNKLKLLKKAYKNHHLFKNEFEEFKTKNDWLKDYALFIVLKEQNNNQSFINFEDKYKYRNKKALEAFYKKNKEEVEAIMFIQYLYKKQWDNLLKYAHKKNVKIVGDMPIYVAYDSVDVWTDKKNFLMDDHYFPTVVAGVPPDYFSKTGQLWGNPIYNYSRMKKDNYSWWVKRVKYAFDNLDYVRIDHFRAFSGYYCIPYGEKTAINGKWRKGPGIALFDEISKNIENPKIIAENLGLLDSKVYKLIEDTNYPGMNILQFEFYDLKNVRKLKKKSPNNVMYPGTHDNNTFVGWYNNDASENEKEVVRKELKLKDETKLTDHLLKYCYKFPFDTVIISYSDVIGLSSEARLNMPGRSINNWQYRFTSSDFKAKTAKKLAKLKNSVN